MKVCQQGKGRNIRQPVDMGVSRGCATEKSKSSSDSEADGVCTRAPRTTRPGTGRNRKSVIKQHGGSEGRVDLSVDGPVDGAMDDGQWIPTNNVQANLFGAASGSMHLGIVTRSSVWSELDGAWPPREET